MPDLYSNTGDGMILGSILGGSTTQLAFVYCRLDSTGDSVVTNETSSGDFTSVSRFAAGRGGGVTFRVKRSFMYFDTSGITNVEEGSVKIKIHGYTANDGSVIAVKSSAFGGDGGTALAVGDLDTIDGFGAFDLDGALNVDVYGEQIITTNWSTSSYNDMTGTAALERDMAGEDVVIICFMDYTYDFKFSVPPSTGTVNCGAYFTDDTLGSRDPYIEYTVGSLGYTHQINPVTAANIGSVITVATADIGKIITVE